MHCSIKQVQLTHSDSYSTLNATAPAVRPAASRLAQAKLTLSDSSCAGRTYCRFSISSACIQ